jgi:hypothetical protein
MAFPPQRRAHDPCRSRQRRSIGSALGQRGDSIIQCRRDIEPSLGQPSLGRRGQARNSPSGPNSLSDIPVGFATSVWRPDLPQDEAAAMKISAMTSDVIVSVAAERHRDC